MGGRKERGKARILREKLKYGDYLILFHSFCEITILFSTSYFNSV